MKPKPFEVAGHLWMDIGGRSFGGADRVALLRAIDEQGSITRGAKAVGLSYKAAWDAVDAMNNLAGEPLVSRVTGGRGGGGAKLTERGRQLVAGFELMQAEHRRFVGAMTAQTQGLPERMSLLRRISIMKTSARNQFFGKVSRIHKGSVNDEVEIEIGNGLGIVAIVTHESVEQLPLKPGSEAFALVKASSVIVLTDAGRARLSARNQLAGKVVRMTPGAVNAEVVIELPGGAVIAAIVTQESVKSLGLKVGVAASALFKASSVIVGVPV